MRAYLRVPRTVSRSAGSRLTRTRRVPLSGRQRSNPSRRSDCARRLVAPGRTWIDLCLVRVVARHGGRNVRRREIRERRRNHRRFARRGRRGHLARGLPARGRWLRHGLAGRSARRRRCGLFGRRRRRGHLARGQDGRGRQRCDHLTVRLRARRRGRRRHLASRSRRRRQRWKTATLDRSARRRRRRGRLTRGRGAGLWDRLHLLGSARGTPRAVAVFGHPPDE